MEWVDFARVENILYLIIVIFVVVLTTIKQFKKQSQSQEHFGKQIIAKIENQGDEIVKLFAVYSQKISELEAELLQLKSVLGMTEEKGGK